LYGLVSEDAPLIYTQPGKGFPPGFEYRWADSGRGIKTPKRCTSPEYVEYVVTWVEDQINNECVFPIDETQTFPRDFKTSVKNIFKRLFRVFAILYHAHFKSIERLGAAAHLNTCFKHFMFFVYEFNLVSDKDLKALKGPTERLRLQFKSRSNQ